MLKLSDRIKKCTVLGGERRTFDTGKVVLVDQQGLDDDEDLVHVRAHEVVQLVQDAINDLDEQVALLVFELFSPRNRCQCHKERIHKAEYGPRET